MNMAAPTHKVELDPKYDQYDYPTVSPNAQSGHPGHTTPEQDAQVHQLRTMLEQLGYKERLDTLTMLRFLRARKFNVQQSKQMFIDCEKWRKDFNVDWLVRNFDYKEKEEVFKYYPQYYHKTDKDGRPVYIEHLGNIDLTAMYKITTAERMLQNLVVEYEKVADPRLPACSRKYDHLLETCCTIMDLKGVGISKANSVYSYVQSASAISQNYYPERLGKLYIINAPWGFSTVFSFIKGFLDPVTVNKIHILGHNYADELLKQIPKENLPQILGGACECDPSCTLSDKGPWHESEYARPPAWEKETSANTPKDAPSTESQPSTTAQTGTTSTEPQGEAAGAHGPASAAAKDEPTPTNGTAGTNSSAAPAAA